MDHAQTLQEIYAAFGRGDIPAILERLAEDVSWEAWDDNSAQRTGVPWMAARSGRDQVPGFFEWAGRLNITGFEVLGIMAGERQAAAEIRLTAEPAPGVVLRDEEMHLFDFGDDGLVTRFRHYVDTAKHAEAAAAAGVMSGAG